MIAMSNPAQSLKLFNQALDMKRKGNLDEALKLYMASIFEYPDDPNVMDTFYAMGKVFYLNGNPLAAIRCYMVYNYLCVSKTSLILSDYEAMKDGDCIAGNRLCGSYENLANHLGWSYYEAMNAPIAEAHQKIYRDLLMGGQKYSSLSGEQQNSYDEQEKNCKNIGYQLIFSDFQKMIDCPNKMHEEFQQDMDYISFSVNN